MKAVAPIVFESSQHLSEQAGVPCHVVLLFSSVHLEKSRDVETHISATVAVPSRNLFPNLLCTFANNIS